GDGAGPRGLHSPCRCQEGPALEQPWPFLRRRRRSDAADPGGESPTKGGSPTRRRSRAPQSGGGPRRRRSEGQRDPPCSQRAGGPSERVPDQGGTGQAPLLLRPEPPGGRGVARVKPSNGRPLLGLRQGLPLRRPAGRARLGKNPAVVRQIVPNSRTAL